MAGPQLVPVEGDPFAADAPTLPPGPPYAQPKLVPVDGDPFADPSHSTLGVARTGAVQGVTDVIGLPDTVMRAAAKVMDWAYPGAKNYRAQMRANPTQPTSGNPRSYVKAAIDSMPEQFTGPSVQQRAENFAFDYIPRDDAQTNFEKYLQLASRGATGAAITGGATAAPGSLFATALRAGAGGAAGAAGGEAAGEATEGTKYEPYARLMANILLGGGVQAGLSKYTTAEGLLSKTLTGYTNADFQAADRLMATAAGQGMRLTPTEALAQVRGGNTPLMGVQRYTENAPESAPAMRTIMEQRPAANAAAVNQSLDNIAPAPAAPTEVGPTVQNAAQQTLNQTRQGINAEAAPHYAQAQSQNDQLVGYGINPYQGPDWQRLTQTPAYQVALTQVRNNPLNANLQNLPDYDLAVMDAVKKRMDLSAGQATNPGIGQQPDTRTAAQYTGAGQTLRRATDNAFPDYQTARQIGQEGRQRFLEPQGRAPIGKLAETSDTAAQQDILLPKLATDGSPQQITQAVTHLVNNGAGQQAAQLIRLKLQDIYETSLPNVRGSAEQFRGANFANNVTRYANQIQSLESAIRAVPGGDMMWGRLNDTIQTLRAQGQRLPAGSATEFNRMLTQAASQGGSIATIPLRATQSIANLGRSAIENMSLRGSQRALAETLQRPNTRGMMEIAQRPNLTKVQMMINALMRSAY